MATITKEQLSGSTSGRPISVAATSTPGTTLHTAHATSDDELWLWVVSNHTADVTLTVELGGTGTGDLIKIRLVPGGGPSLIVPGIPMTGSVVTRAFATTTAVVTAYGFVNRITL